NVIHSYGGTIAVRSEAGRGTTFRVTLPAVASARVSASVRPTAPEIPAASRRGKVLVIDDEESIGRTLKRILAKEHDVVALTSAVEGRARIEGGERFDVVLCDLMMPELTGMEFYAAVLRAAPEQAERIILMTGGAFTTRAAQFLDEVPNPRVEKPFDISGLRATVRMFVS
ncbi:MAG: response regulator, partial [Polyangiaceae bacterium]